MGLLLPEAKAERKLDTTSEYEAILVQNERRSQSIKSTDKLALFEKILIDQINMH